MESYYLVVIIFTHFLILFESVLPSIITAQTNRLWFDHFGLDEGLTQVALTCITQDSMGFIWIGTDGGGLNRFDRQTETFVSYANDPNDSTSLSQNSVYAIFEDSQQN